MTPYTVVNRIDWRKKRSMGSDGAKEFLWSANVNDSQADSLLTHLVHDHYSSRADGDGFDWERRSKPIDAHNVAARAKLFAGAVTQQCVCVRMCAWGLHEYMHVHVGFI